MALLEVGRRESDGVGEPGDSFTGRRRKWMRGDEQPVDAHRTCAIARQRGEELLTGQACGAQRDDLFIVEPDWGGAVPHVGPVDHLPPDFAKSPDVLDGDLTVIWRVDRKGRDPGHAAPALEHVVGEELGPGSVDENVGADVDGPPGLSGSLGVHTDR
jgi:hypothetical protein